MATADTRRTLASRRRLDRDRKRRQRDAERQVVPRADAVDHAIAVALRRQIVERYETIKRVPKTSELHGVIVGAVAVLQERGYDTKQSKTRSRLRTALGHDKATSPITPSSGN